MTDAQVCRDIKKKPHKTKLFKYVSYSLIHSMTHDTIDTEQYLIWHVHIAVLDLFWLAKQTATPGKSRGVRKWQQANLVVLQAQPRPSQGPADASAAARMLQNMPTAEYIARTLGMDKAGVESLLAGNQQGRSYLAQQLAQRGAVPGGGLTPGTAPQQAAGAVIIIFVVAQAYLGNQLALGIHT